MAVSLVAGCAAHAVEPDGRVGIRHEWVATDGAATIAAYGPGPGEVAILRLHFRAESPIREARVRITPPSGVEIRSATGADIAAQGLALGELAVGRAVSLDLRVGAPRTGGGIVAIRVEGLDPDGSAVSDGTGVPVGTPGTAPARRHGALEFPGGRGGGTRP